MTKVERVMQDFMEPLASFSCTTPYFLHTSLSVSASSRIETPCWSRKPAWQRQSSGLTPRTTQSWRGKNALLAGENGGSPEAWGGGALGEKKSTTRFFSRGSPGSTPFMAPSGSERAGGRRPSTSATRG